MVQQQAIALCRVSTAEQKLSNSLNRQEQSVINASKTLGVEIVETISGDASSKVGKNFNRPDLLRAYEVAKSNKRIKYLIVDEVDRFMRSNEEMFYWITRLKYELGVKVHFASNPELNGEGAQTSLLLSFDAYKAEASNEERQRKSVNGHIQALKEGRYTFHPKPGYMSGEIDGIHIREPNSFVPLQNAFREIIAQEYTPTEALKRLMQTTFGQRYKRFDMDKFRKYAKDPYYAGIVEMDKQVKARNENGLHERMISIDEHEQLKAIMDGTYKPRGATKQYNPEFPMNKMLQCADCGSKFTGAKKTNGRYRQNGKLRTKINTYYKYRCRGCKKEYHRDEVHESLDSHIDTLHPLNEVEGFREALEIVWRQRNADKLNQAKGLRKRLQESEELKSSLVVEYARANSEMKLDLQLEIDKIKHQITDLEKQIEGCSILDEQLMEFVEFAMNYTKDLKSDWWRLDSEERQRCQHLLFSEGIYMNSQKKVSTPKISSFYTYKIQKTSSKTGQIASMVELVGTAPTSIG